MPYVIAPDAPVKKRTKGVARFVTIDRPSHGNALDLDALEALTDAFEEIDELGDIRILFLNGARGVFCSGGDQGDSSSCGKSDEQLRWVSRMFEALRTASVLTVALVDGPAIGFGAGLAAACDCAVATRRATFGFPETRSGLIPSVVAPYVMDAIGARAARRLFVLGRTISAEDAVRLGLAERVVANELALQQAAEEYIAEVKRVAPGAGRAAKRLTTELVATPFSLRILEETLRRIAIRRKTAEAIEGVRARRANQSPRWVA